MSIRVGTAVDPPLEIAFWLNYLCLASTVGQMFAVAEAVR
jgi:hypothetical protein